jgi:glycosyltransferase involved in cell wall biosynthesis
MLHPGWLLDIMRRFKPEHIHIEEDPHSLIGVESVSLARLACPKATISFFIWDNLAREPRFPINVIKKTLTRYSFSRAALVICGNLEAEHLLKSAKCYHGHTLVLPQIGIDPEYYAGSSPTDLVEKIGKTSDIPLIGFIGRLVPEKGILLLLEALLRLQMLPWKLLIVGNGTLRDEIHTVWKSKLGERLILVDSVPHAQVAQYLRCLDVFVLPSYGTPVWKEQFGLTLAQAMMAGVACIGSSSGAIPEVIGMAGMVVPEQDITALARALETILCSEPTRRRLQGEAKAFALQRYANASVAKRYLDVFQLTISQANI